MEIQQVRALHAISRHGSFGKAAKALARTQPAITLAIQALEKELGMPLMERVGRGSRLSAAGRSLVEETSPFLALWDRLPDTLRRMPTKRSVRVGASHTAAHYLLPAPCASFISANPEVSVEIIQQGASESWDMLRRGELDFAVRSPAAPPPDLIFVPFQKFERVVISPMGFGLHVHKLAMADLKGKRFVVPGRDSRFRRLLETRLEEAGVSVDIAVEAGNWEAVKRYVTLGIGAALVPGACIEPDDRAHLIVHSAGRLFGRDTFGIFSRGGLTIGADARAFVEAIDPRAASEL